MKRNELPVNPKSDDTKGIKVRFDRAEDKYPGTVFLLMTDGTWIEYERRTEQPGFVAAMESLKSGRWETGYPARK